MDAKRLEELAKGIGTAPSFYVISDDLEEIGAMLNAEARKRFPTDTGMRHAFIYGALISLDALYGWDVKTKTQTQEESIFWMFSYLFAYKT